MTHLPPELPPHLEGQTSTWLSKSTSASVLGNPLVWSAVTALLIFIGYLWLQFYAKPISVQLEQSHTQDELIGSGQRGGWNPDIYRSIETETSMNITRQADDIRAEGYRTEIDHQDKIQPLLNQARERLDNEALIGTDGNNAWQLYQRVLEIEPEHKIALSGKEQIVSLLQENAEFAVDEEQFAEAELWLNQLDLIQPGASFQADLRRLIVDRINENLALEQAAQLQAEKKLLLSTALRDASAAMQASPPRLREAYDLYQRVLELDEANSSAIDGLHELHAKRIAMALAAISSGDFSSAQIQIERLQQTQAEKSVTDKLLDELLTAKTKKDQARPAPETDNPLAPVVPDEAEVAPSNNSNRNKENSALTPTEIDTRMPSFSTTLGETPTLPPETSIQVTGRARPKVDEIQIQAPPLSQVENVSTKKPSNDAKSMLSRGILAYYTGDYESAFSTLHPLAEEGNARAQFRIGMMYYNGRSVVKNTDLARQWIARALPTILRTAQADQAWAQADLGTAYELGVGVIQDPRRAATWYLKSANQGYAGAQANLGVLYGNGNGVKYDRQIALYWLKRAAVQGDKVAQDNLRVLNAR